jgi:hypothetical protein
MAARPQGCSRLARRAQPHHLKDIEPPASSRQHACIWTCSHHRLPPLRKCTTNSPQSLQNWTLAFCFLQHMQKGLASDFMELHLQSQMARLSQTQRCRQRTPRLCTSHPPTKLPRNLPRHGHTSRNGPPHKRPRAHSAPLAPIRATRPTAQRGKRKSSAATDHADAISAIDRMRAAKRR